MKQESWDLPPDEPDVWTPAEELALRRDLTRRGQAPVPQDGQVPGLFFSDKAVIEELRAQMFRGKGRKTSKELVRAADRIDRRAQAMEAQFAAEAKPLKLDVRPEDVPADLEVEVRRRRVRRERARAAAGGRAKKPRDFLSGAIAGVCLFLAAALPQIPLIGIGIVPVMLLSGLISGLGWQLTKRGRFSCSLISAVTYLVLVMVPRLPTEGDLPTIILALLPLLMGFAVVTWVSGLIGFDREMRRSGGFAK